MTKFTKFLHGIELFITRVCRGNRDMYTQLMTRNLRDEDDGYFIAVLDFDKVVGGLTSFERKQLEEKVIPDFAVQVYRQLETEYFGIDLISHRISS